MRILNMPELADEGIFLYVHNAQKERHESITAARCETGHKGKISVLSTMQSVEQGVEHTTY
jgi:hypothetical protein